MGCRLQRGAEPPQRGVLSFSLHSCVLPRCTQLHQTALYSRNLPPQRPACNCLHRSTQFPARQHPPNRLELSIQHEREADAGQQLVQVLHQPGRWGSVIRVACAICGLHIHVRCSRQLLCPAPTPTGQLGAAGNCARCPMHRCLPPAWGGRRMKHPPPLSRIPPTSSLHRTQTSLGSPAADKKGHNQSHARETTQQQH